MGDLYAQIEKDKETVDWLALEPHAKRQALFLVDGSLDLVSAGVAIASDDKQRVEEWLNQKMIRRPADSEIATWQKESGRKFSFIIVQPYVLCQVQDL